LKLIPLDAIIIGTVAPTPYMFQLNCIFNPKWAIFVLCHYFIQWETHEDAVRTSQRIIFH